jgi:4'-phosphopantetheinyl transferase
MHSQGSIVYIEEIEAAWQQVNSPTRPEPGIVEIWRLHFPSYIPLTDELYIILHPEEKIISASFKREKDRQRYIIGKAALRILLGNYLNINPTAVKFIPGENDKPALGEGCPIDFNISHSEDYMLIAIANTPVGIDIEYYNTRYQINDMMHFVFSEGEILFIKNNADSYSAFYQLWTRKEAFLKAVSKGLNGDILSVPCLNGRHLIKEKLNNDWKVSSFNVTGEYTASIAYPAETQKILFNLYDKALSHFVNQLTVMPQL